MYTHTQGFDKYGIYHMESIKTPKLLQSLQLKNGVVSSGNSLDYCDEDMKLMDVCGDVGCVVLVCGSDVLKCVVVVCGHA